MKLATSCICCGSKNLTHWLAELMPFIAHRTQLDENVMTVECRDCGAMFVDARFSADEMAAIYTDYRGEDYIREREYFEPGYRERQAGFTGLPYIGKVEDFLRPYLGTNKRILDWGGNDGVNTPFKNSPADVYDPSGATVKHGQAVDKPSGFYDLIVFANVIEHVPYPAKALKDIRRHMTDGCLLYIEVSLDDATNKKRWHEHINVFTEKALAKLCERCGLIVMETKQLEEPPYRPYLMACRKDEHGHL